jgi:hypothetical protein
LERIHLEQEAFPLSIGLSDTDPFIQAGLECCNGLHERDGGLSFSPSQAKGDLQVSSDPVCIFLKMEAIKDDPKR